MKEGDVEKEGGGGGERGDREDIQRHRGAIRHENFDKRWILAFVGFGGSLFIHSA